MNIAYEAATADLDDRNIIDPFHLAAYDKVTVNYNRDVESFPVLKAMLDGIMGESPYQSPTDMGVNMVGFCITDDEVCREAGKREIVRRYFNQAEFVRRTGNGKEALAKLEIIMSKAGVDVDLSPARAAALEKEERTGRPAAAMELPDGTLIVGKTSEIMGAASTLLLKSLKHLAGVDQEKYIVGDEALQPINRLKTELMHSRNPRLHSDEMLIALSISSATNPLAKQAIDAAEGLRGCDAYFSVIISEADRRVMRALGINVCCEPKYEREGFYHK